MRTANVRTLAVAIVSLAAVGLVDGCSSDSGPTKRVSASGMPCCIATDEGNTHVAYLVNTVTAVGGKGELHVASADGKDVKVVTGISPRGFVVAPKGQALFYAQLLPSGQDASLNYLDLRTPNAQPRTLFAGGWPTQLVTPGLASSPQYATIESNNFFSPSGRYFMVGVLQPNVSVSADLHVIDVETGNDVFSRGNGAYDYFEALLPDDTLIYQDSVGGNGGAGGPPPVDTLFWISLPQAGSTQPTVIDTHTGKMLFTSDDKTLVYQKTDRSLWSWDTVAKPAAPTNLAGNAVQFTVGNAPNGRVAYIGIDQSVHVVGLMSVPGATAKAHLLSTVTLASDGNDLYYFQNVEWQNRRGTLMHVALAPGPPPAPVKIADNASIYDVHPVPGGLLYLQNVDEIGQFGDAMRAARDGSGAASLGVKVPTFGIGSPSTLNKIGAGSDWFVAHLAGASIDKDKKLVDGQAAIVGQLALVTSASAGETVIDPGSRQGQFAISDDYKSLFYIGGVVFDPVIDNYVGALEQVATSSPSTQMAAPILKGASEIGPVVGTTVFCNAPKASTPGVYFVKLGP